MQVLYPRTMDVGFPGDDGLQLQPACRGRLLRPDLAQAKGTILAFHGFSAGPWQFESLADDLLALGWNVLLPRLAGHGHATTTGAEDPRFLPRAHEAGRYREAAEQALSVARSLEPPLVLCGLSAGGAVALDLAIRHGGISRVCAMAPLLVPAAPRARLVYRLVQATDGPLGGRVGRWLDNRPFAWGDAPPRHEDGWVRPGHWRFAAGNLVGILRFVADILPRAHQLTIPLQLLTTSRDDLADPVAAGRFWARHKATGGGWQHFVAKDGVPHAMISPRQHPDARSRMRVVKTVLDFLDAGTPTHVPPPDGRLRA